MLKVSRIRDIASDCPNQKLLTLVEYQALEEAELREEGSDKDIHPIEFEEECAEEADKGELLMLRRALSDRRVSNREEQRENILHTRSTING